METGRSEPDHDPWSRPSSPTCSSSQPYPKVVATYHDTKQAERTQVTAGDGEPVYTLRHPYATEAEARSAAASAPSKAAGARLSQ